MFIKERGRVWGFLRVLSPLRKSRKFSDLSCDFMSVFSVLNRDFYITACSSYLSRGIEARG
jgi:hypothetical protein